ncbi:TPA: sterol desaturase family protein [Legionella pneumophila]|nr:sterol desaturase family protein [Legionella pneumophila]HBI2947366.1 sterol desaturase family protein [Legionella pneumophila]
MDINLMVFASPLFLLLIGIEYWVACYKKSGVYQLNDSVNNFSSGILEEIGALPIKGVIIYGYYYLYEHYAIFNVNPQSIFSWLFLWLGVDFFYYWYHRVSHRNSFFWIGHSVHHQSEQFNLSVALRQGYFQTLTSWVFYLPLALIGFPTWMFVIVASVNTIYQFWIHTESIRKMGWFEKIFNTPSHHRVHHGKNPQYIDKNYAGSLIIWDKLFGTFEPEKEPADYGVTEPLDSWNPFYANVKVVKDILYYGKGLKNKWDVLRAFFMPPEWIIHRLQQENSPVSKKIMVKKNTGSPAIYMLINTAFAVFLYTYLSLVFDPAIVTSWLIGTLILLTLYTLGRVADGNSSIFYLEIVRATLVLLILFLLKNTLMLSFGFSVLFYAINYALCNIYHYKRTTSSF